MFRRGQYLHAGIGSRFVRELEMLEQDLPRQMAITGKAGSTLSRVMGKSRTRTPVAL